MNETLKATMDMIRSIGYSSRVKHSRTFLDFFSDRIMQCATQPTLMSAVQRLSRLMDSDPGEIPGGVASAFLKACFNGDTSAILIWLRENYPIAAMLKALKQEDYLACIENIEIYSTDSDGSAIRDIPHDINLTFTCVSPLAHGADVKAGNASLFRRMDVLATNGSVIRLPFYAGNALRGQMRDLLADDLVRALGLVPRRDKPPLSLWFFQVLYSGGSLEENSKAEKALRDRLGQPGFVRSAGIYEFRNMLPTTSILGTALGSRILPGRIQVGDMRPACKQWGNGDIEASNLFEWLYLTRHEDHEEHEENHSMIATTEALKAGTILHGGIDLDRLATDIEKSALGHGLQLLAKSGYIGAENRRGLGRVKVEWDAIPSPDPYKAYLQSTREVILQYLSDLGAINACN